MAKPLYKLQITKLINNATSLTKKHGVVVDIVVQAIKQFNEHETQKYYSYSGKTIKRAKPSHTTTKGRYNQIDARTILISGLTRAWIFGAGVKATINNKRQRDTPFVMFASDVFTLVGIGNTHKHLEEYTAIRKADFIRNESIKDLDFTD